MTSPVLVIEVIAFLAGAASAAFAMIVIGIREVDRHRHLPPARSTPLDAVTRSVLQADTWNNGPAVGDLETGWPARRADSLFPPRPNTH
jgi:hypothetical protein